MASKEEIESLKKEIETLKQRCTQIQKSVNDLTSTKAADKEDDAIDPDKTVGLESRLEEIAEQISNMQAALSQQIEDVQDQANEIENGLGVLVERVNVGGGGPEGATQDMSGLQELYKKLDQMQCDMEVITNTSSKLIAGAEERAYQMDIIAQQIEELMTSKADREELDEALLDKADRSLVNKKVSQERFCNTMDELYEALQDSVMKLEHQEKIWHEALNQFQNEIATKLDKKEMVPLKEFINKKLRMLHKRLRALAKMRQAAEAAAAKKNMMKDLNCISCDYDAVMMKEYPGNVPIPPQAVPNLNVRPYLTYELDMIRKQQRKPPSKIMNHFEAALSRAPRPKPVSRWINLCNRYCGGTHTMTTPQQRVTRVAKVIPCMVTPAPTAPGPAQAVVEALVDAAMAAAPGHTAAGDVVAAALAAATGDGGDGGVGDDGGSTGERAAQDIIDRTITQATY